MSYSFSWSCISCCQWCKADLRHRSNCWWHKNNFFRQFYFVFIQITFSFNVQRTTSLLIRPSVLPVHATGLHASWHNRVTSLQHRFKIVPAATGKFPVRFNPDILKTNFLHLFLCPLVPAIITGGTCQTCSHGITKTECQSSTCEPLCPSILICRPCQDRCSLSAPAEVPA